MKVTKQVKTMDLSIELRLIPERIAESVDLVLALPRMLVLAKAFCPVKTGALRDSIRVERPNPCEARLVAGGSSYINPATGRPVDYARHVHDGTSRTQPRPFLLQAATAERVAVAHEIQQRTAEAIL